MRWGLWEYQQGEYKYESLIQLASLLLNTVEKWDKMSHDFRISNMMTH